MDKTAFELGVADGMDKVALSQQLMARAAAKRGVSPMVYQAAKDFTGSNKAWLTKKPGLSIRDTISTFTPEARGGYDRSWARGLKKKD